MKKSVPYEKICSIVLVAMFLTSCSSFGPKPHVLYSRPDLETKVSKIIVFPTTDFEGKTNQSLKAIDLSVNTAWVNAYGADKVIPAGIVIEKISNVFPLVPNIQLSLISYFPR